MAPKKKFPSEKSSGLPGLELAEIERLLGFMEKHDLQEFEFAHGDFRVSLKRAGGNTLSHSNTHPAVSVPPPRSAPDPLPGVAVAPAAPAPAPAAESQDHVVKSPIVGTFYSSPSPEAESFVKVGDRVNKGQVICIVEAMKLMNEIEADVSGEIVRVMAENGQPVEYGQALFAIRP